MAARRVPAVGPILFEEKVRIPPGLGELEAFRRWARSDQFPRRGRFAFLRDELWVDLSPEQAFTHNQVKAEFSEVLHGSAKAQALGYFFVDRMLLSNPDVGLATEPDGML